MAASNSSSPKRWLPFLMIVVASLIILLVTTNAQASSSSIQQYLDYAVKGDVNKLVQLLEQEPELLNQQDAKTGRTAALEAALNGQLKVIESLYNLGADLVLRTEVKGGFSVLDAAIELGHSSIVKFMLEKVEGLNVNEETPKDGLRPIHRASNGMSQGSIEILKALVKTGKVGANDRSREGMTPIEYVLRLITKNQFREAQKLTQTALGYKRELIQILLDNGANAAQLSDDHITTLGLSFRDVEQYKTKPVAKAQFPEFRKGTYTTADERMLEAVQRSDWEWMAFEITQKGANVNAKNKNNKQTSFMTACLKGDVATLRKLLEFKADPSVAEENGYTPFHGAGFQGHAEVAKVLMEDLGLDPNDMHKDGYRPIHRACWGKQPRHAEFVRFLLSTGKVDPDSRTAKGLTPLQVLASSDSYKNADTAKVLVQFGADVSLLKEKDIETLKITSDDDFQTCPSYTKITM